MVETNFYRFQMTGSICLNNISVRVSQPKLIDSIEDVLRSTVPEVTEVKYRINYSWCVTRFNTAHICTADVEHWIWRKIYLVYSITGRNIHKLAIEDTLGRNDIITV